jgi:glycosyltransferase involved in cell wall biosynthesis
MVPAYLRAASAWRRRLARIASRRYARVIAVSSAIRDALASLDVCAERIEVIPAYLGVERSGEFHEAPVLNWMRDRNPVLSTALFFRPEYGFDLLVEALTRLRERHPSLGCVVMGSGEDRAKAERLLVRGALAESILLAGDVDHDVCLAVIAASDVFVRPTLEDGDSISVREALSLGVPVVASRVGTRPEGTMLFRTGSVTDLVARIEEALLQPEPAPASIRGSIDRLMSVYHAAA